MEIFINYQGILAENTGTMSESISESGSISELLKTVKQKHPSLGKLNFIVAVNGVISHGENKIRGGDHISLIPPAPGG